MLLYELTDAFEKAKLKYALVGGYALALHGLVRKLKAKADGKKYQSLMIEYLRSGLKNS